MQNTVSLRALLFSSIICLNLFAQSEVESIHAPGLTERFPLRSIDRPSVMPTGIIQAETSLGLTGLKTVGWNIATQFGIVNKLEGSVSYDGLEFNAWEPKKIVRLGAKYNYFGINHVSFNATANVPLHILDGEVVQDFTLGLPTVFYNDYVAGCILGDLYNLRVRPTVEMAFGFPWWFGAQVYGNWWAMVESSFGKIKMENPKNDAKWAATGFWKALPATLSLTYAFNHYVDLGGNFGFGNIMEAKDSIKFGLTLSVRGGRLFG